MSPRKPTIDGLDDVDDEDGIIEEETQQETDLSLETRTADDVGLGGTASADEISDDEVEFGDVDEEDEGVEEEE